MASNSEIVISVQEESDPVDDETDEDDDNNESSKNPSDAASDSCVCDSYGVVRTTECCPTQLLLLKRIRYLAAKKRRCTMIERKRTPNITAKKFGKL
ncbi:UNVERIFIED_CONTAM: hypothetical protein NCL1_10930 [Trichonephila clavipes]